MFRIQIELESVWWSYSKCGERSNFPIWSCCIALLLWLLLASLWPVLLCQHFSRSRIWISGKKDLSLIFCLLTCHHLRRRTPHAEIPSDAPWLDILRHRERLVTLWNMLHIYVTCLGLINELFIISGQISIFYFTGCLKSESKQVLW